jgi:hypothetical protein
MESFSDIHSKQFKLCLSSAYISIKFPLIWNLHHPVLKNRVTVGSNYYWTELGTKHFVTMNFLIHITSLLDCYHHSNVQDTLQLCYNTEQVNMFIRWVQWPKTNNLQIKMFICQAAVFIRTYTDTTATISLLQDTWGHTCSHCQLHPQDIHLHVHSIKQQLFYMYTERI